MPTYEYRCPKGHEFELFQKMSARPGARCPECGQPAERQISGGAGLVFKGSGFYITDYGKDGKGPRKAPSEEGAAPTKAEGPKPEGAKKSEGAATPAPKKPAPEPKQAKSE